MTESYVHSKHYEMVAKWFHDRNMEKPDPLFFYDTGFIVDGIVVGFLCKTNSRLAYIEHVASDPNSESFKRKCALNTLFHKLEDEAKASGFEMLAGLANKISMQKRFEFHKFDKFGNYDLYIKKWI